MKNEEWRSFWCFYNLIFFSLFYILIKNKTLPVYLDFRSHDRNIYRNLILAKTSYLGYLIWNNPCHTTRRSNTMFYYDWHLPWSVAKQSMTSRLSQSAFWSSAVTSGGLTPYLLPPILSASSSVKNKWCGDTSHVTWIPFSLAARITRTYSTNTCTISKNKQDYTRGNNRTCLTALCSRLKTRTTATMPEKCVHSLKVKNWLHLETSEQNMKMNKFH